MTPWKAGTSVDVEPRRVREPRRYTLVKQPDGTWTGERHVIGDDDDLRRNYRIVWVHGIERFHKAIEIIIDELMIEANARFDEASDRTLGYTYS